MKLLGVPLRRPDFNELTASFVLGAGLWVFTVGLMRASQVELTKGDAGALLLVMLWACVSARMGIRVGQGGRHLAANFVGCGMLLGLYDVARVLA